MRRIHHDERLREEFSFGLVCFGVEECFSGSFLLMALDFWWSVILDIEMRNGFRI